MVAWRSVSLQLAPGRRQRARPQYQATCLWRPQVCAHMKAALSLTPK
jgi:hypothetical protein